MPEARPLHLLKLCVGAEGVADLAAWQADRAAAARAAGLDPAARHVTRMWPRRAGELLAGGSLYWVFRGLVLARQRILALEAVESGESAPRCAIVLAPDIVRTQAQPRRPFQGWRYLTEADAPRDLADGPGAQDARLPPPLEIALAEIGVIERRRRCG
ncbi:MAG: DUF1489 domain-containing protein [Rubrimonas sp.]|uniref:DUF1489 family protein n=1 Tax=Rubrimonas sp. TaxID=2036015 RepID=UPI002FDEB0B2